MKDRMDGVSSGDRGAVWTYCVVSGAKRKGGSSTASNERPERLAVASAPSQVGGV